MFKVPVLSTLEKGSWTNLQQAAICPQCLCLHENSPAGLSGMCKDLIIEQALGKIGMSVVLKHSSWPWGVSESWYQGWGWYENLTELKHDYMLFWANDSPKFHALKNTRKLTETPQRPRPSVFSVRIHGPPVPPFTVTYIQHVDPRNYWAPKTLWNCAGVLCHSRTSSQAIR